MPLKNDCPICAEKMTINLESGLIYCPNCGFQPFFEWQKISDESKRVKIHPLYRQGSAVAQSEIIECPHCGSANLNPIAKETALRCAQCSTVYPIKTTLQTNTQSLRDLHLQRKNQAIRWEVTNRLINCESCGAQSTLNPRVLNQKCPFCDSMHVLVRDSQQSFEAPDAFLPFKIDGERASEIVQYELNSGLQKLLGLFRDKVVKISGVPLYLPWWLFEMTIEAYYAYDKGYGQFNETLTFDIPIYAALGDEVSELLPYRLSELVSYSPTALGQVQAEVYQVDVTHAAHAAVKEAIKLTEKEIYDKNPNHISIAQKGGGSAGSMLKVTPHIKDTQYRLILLPLWNIFLEEDDGDVRRVLVNGYNGKVHFEANGLWRK